MCQRLSTRLAPTVFALILALSPSVARAQMRPLIAPAPVSPPVVTPAPSPNIQTEVHGLTETLAPPFYFPNTIYLLPSSTYSSANYKKDDSLAFQFLQDTYVTVKNPFQSDPNNPGDYVVCKIAAGTVVPTTVQYDRRRDLFRQGKLMVGLTPTISVTATTVPQNDKAMPTPIVVTLSVSPTSPPKSDAADPRTIAVGTSDKMYPWLTVIAACLTASSSFLQASGWKHIAYGVGGMTLVGSAVGGNGLLGNDATVNAGNVYAVTVTAAKGYSYPVGAAPN